MIFLKSLIIHLPILFLRQKEQIGVIGGENDGKQRSETASLSRRNESCYYVSKHINMKLYISMTDEMIDIVDEHNNEIGQAFKQEAHEKGFLHRTIIAEVINSKREWVLVKQALDRQDAGQYVSPIGGHIRSGESEEHALKREAVEEMGLKDFIYKRIGEAVFNRHILNRQENHLFILYEIYSNEKPKLNHESESYKTFTGEEIKALLRKSSTILETLSTLSSSNFILSFSYEKCINFAWGR